VLEKRKKLKQRGNYPGFRSNFKMFVKYRNGNHGGFWGLLMVWMGANDMMMR